MSKRHSSDIAVKLGWELSRTSSGRVRMTCPHGCCVVIAERIGGKGDSHTRAYKNSVSLVRACPGEKAQAARRESLQEVTTQFEEVLGPPDAAAVHAFREQLRVDDSKTEAPPEHNATIARVAGLRIYPTYMSNQCWDQLATKGLFYRTNIGVYVLDPNARISRSKITHNLYPVHIGSALNDSGSKKAESHPYRNLKFLEPWAVRRPRRTEEITTPTPTPTPTPAPEPEPEPVAAPAAPVPEPEPQPDTRPWRPVVAEVQPGGLDDVVLIIGRKDDQLVLQSSTEIIICNITQVVPR